MGRVGPARKREEGRGEGRSVAVAAGRQGRACVAASWALVGR
jgi:hypothetical protein